MGAMTLEQLIVDTAEAVRPPERLTVAEAAEKYRKLNNPGSYVGPFKNSKTPYMVEPMEVLTSLDYRAMIFVGPAQSGKSDVALNWITYSAVSDPADLLIVEKSQTAARDFADRRVAKLLRDTTAVSSRVLPGKHNQSLSTTRFKNGMLVNMSWPTVNELSGKPIGRIWMPDYDRMPDDVGGEGSPFDLARQRTKTFKNFGMTAAESSPSRPVENPKWKPRTPHEAPPTSGILALYNRGDRRRWYWICVACDEAFEPDFALMEWPSDMDVLEAAAHVRMPCPHCGTAYYQAKTEHTPSRQTMNQNAIWIPDRCRWDSTEKRVVGDPIPSTTASFWLKGPAAAFADWSDIVAKYIQAQQEFETTGDDSALKTTINTDQALPYTPLGLGDERLPEELKSRSRELGEKVVPSGVRFLVASIDIQKNRFEVQVHGFGEDGDAWLIDRFRIRKSERYDEDGERYPVNPAAYPEDWHLLTKEVVEKTYPLGDGSGREMAIKITGIDSGGREGVTINAYDYWRYLAYEDGRQLHRRVYLIKGDARPSQPLAKVDYPDAERKDKRAAARGEVPILFIQTDKVKDQLNSMLERTEPGGGYVSFPLWLEDWFYAEMTAETRTAKGWINSGKYRNEAWDLFGYALGLAYSSKIALGIIDWSDPPGWAAEWDRNDLVAEEGNKRFESHEKRDIDLGKLAGTLA